MRQFHIDCVTGPDEYTAIVNDNFYTNLMAQHNLRAAAEELANLAVRQPSAYAQAVSRLKIAEGEPAQWLVAAEGMYLPFDAERGLHPQDAQFFDKEIWDLKTIPAQNFPLLLHYHPLVIYRHQVLKQADVVLALCLFSDKFSQQQKRADFDYYEPLTTGDSTLSAAAQGVIASEVGYGDLALDYFCRALYVDLADTQGNTVDGVHIASTGGIWSALVNGFGGLRDSGQQLSFEPRLPEKWRELRFQLIWRGINIKVMVEATSISFECEYCAVRGGDGVIDGVIDDKYGSGPAGHVADDGNVTPIEVLVQGQLVNLPVGQPGQPTKTAVKLV